MAFKAAATPPTPSSSVGDARARADAGGAVQEARERAAQGLRVAREQHGHGHAQDLGGPAILFTRMHGVRGGRVFRQRLTPEMV